ncbi:metallophosphoesterase [Phenylobacterium sp.]|uniref:metallophosphoesterase family protein n=1 Tax=Phenylobacterium sp. TaxID=1871053 RepID=UPI00374CB7C3
MKILLVSDLHYALKQYDWTAAVAPDFDVVVVAGDHLDIAGQLGGGVQIVVILKYLRRLAARTRLIVSSGNHDLDRRDESGERIPAWMERVRRLGIATDGDSLKLGETLVTICPWWDGPKAREAVRAQIERDALTPKAAWIWVYHAPPEGSPTSWDGKQSWGDKDLTAWIETYQPDLVLCGHIHQAPFKRDGSWVDRIGETWVFNAGRQIGETPAHIAIDTDAREAAWFSLAGAELVRLDHPLQRPLAELLSPPAWLAAPIPDRDPILA